jgi:2-hydroxychromene-2-carboxylate isomerase
MPDATFYFDLGSPYAYLAAERLQEVLGEPTIALAGELFWGDDRLEEAATRRRGDYN